MSGASAAAGSAAGIALLAGEASGDTLGGAIAEALRRRRPGLELFGVTGKRMRAAGVESLESIDALSLMGIAEVASEIPRLLRLRARLRETLVARQPACVVGIDAPDFNLGLEKRLRADGLRCVHVVSPTVWAWRPGRTRTVAASADALLALFPFEPACYRDVDLDVRYVGHPLADELSPGDAAASRAALGLAAADECVAVLPGSRGAEIAQLMPRFVAAADWLLSRRRALRFVVPVAKPALRAPIQAAIAAGAQPGAWSLHDGRARDVVSAADVVLVASGTATLECLLLGRPMVVAYRVSPLTEFLLRKVGLLKVDSVSLPNLLIGEPLVPELLQDDAEPAVLGMHLYRLLARADLRAAQQQAFARVAADLRVGAAERAAEAILEIADGG